jgi:peptide/nickel transport system permease protein
MRYFVQKILFYVVALWAALTLNFLIPRLLPGNPVDILLSKLAVRGPVTPELRDQIVLLLGGDSDAPLWVQYGNYLGGLVRGDLGVSVTYYPQQVTTIIGNSIWWTILLIGVATIISFLIGIALGALAGWKRGSWLDSLIPVSTMFTAVPYFWLALILLYVFAGMWKIFPISGGYSYTGASIGWSWEFISSAVYFAALPAITIVLASVGGWLLGMRNMMVSTLAEDYIVTAEAKGLRPRRILVNYAARNAVLPSVAGFAISLGFVVAGSVIVEQVFSYPGIGSALLQAVNGNDYALMQGVFLVITLAVLGANLLVDLLYGFIDPRTRSRR